MSLELQVSGDTPPSFLWHTVADTAVPVENSLLFAQALQAARVPFEMHLFPNGPHGLSLATVETSTADLAPNPEAAQWMGLSITWLRKLFSFPQ
jgi:acetyl esterase/lipase